MDTPKEYANRFSVTGTIAERPSCRVYRATDRESGSEVALRVFVDRPGSNPELIKSYQDEFERFKAVEHPALVPIIHYGLENGWFYLVMEYLQGPTLRSLLKEQSTPFPIERAVNIISCVLGGLDALHQRGIFHGHLDSRGILFRGDQPIIAGYYPLTISKIHKTVTSEGRLLVDSSYIAPEQVTGAEALDHRADIYSAAVLLFEMLTGEKPFSSKNQLQTALMRLSQPVPSPRNRRADISSELDAAVMKGLAKSAAERFQSVSEMLRDIALPQVTVAAVPMPEPQPIRPERAERVEGTGAFTSAGAFAPRLSPLRDSTQTYLGLEAKSLLRASLVVLNGNERGEKHLLDKSQLMLGNDAGCDIWLSGRDIPPRYAVVSQRGSDYFVKSISETPLTLNGKEQQQNEIMLTSGNVLHVGSYQLRFVAPGEQFSIAEEEETVRADDSTVSKLNKVLIAIALMLMLGAIGIVFAYQRGLNLGQGQF